MGYTSIPLKDGNKHGEANGGHNKGGASKDELRYDEETVVDVVSQRLHWLFIFFLGLLVAALVTEVFEEVLKQQVQLSYFVPLLIGHGGNAGSQSVTTMIRALALKHVDPWKWEQVGKACVKESTAGAIMGGGLGLVIYTGSHFWHGLDERVGLVVCLGLICVSFLANLLGALLPCLSIRFGFNPAVSSAPLLTTVIDAFGLIIYFMLAKVVLHI